MKMTTTVADGLLTSGFNAITLMRRDCGNFRLVWYTPAHCGLICDKLLHYITHALTWSTEKWHTIFCNVVAWNGFHCAKVHRRNNNKGMWTDALSVLTVFEWQWRSETSSFVSICSFKQGSDSQSSAFKVTIPATLYSMVIIIDLQGLIHCILF